MLTLDSEKLLDEVGWQILGELQENARLSFSELGRRVGLTAPAVGERVRRMEEAGIIAGYRLELDAEKIGLPVTAFIRLASSDVKLAQFAAQATVIPEVLECHRVTGADSYIIKVGTTSVQHLETVINRLILYGQPTTSLVLSSPVKHRVIRAPLPTEEAPTRPRRSARARATAERSARTRAAAGSARSLERRGRARRQKTDEATRRPGP